MAGRKSFFGEFDTPTKAEWQALYGAHSEKMYQLADELHSRVFIPPKEVEPTSIQSTKDNNDWKIIQYLRPGSIQKANEIISRAAEQGVDGFYLSFKRYPKFLDNSIFEGVDITKYHLVMELERKKGNIFWIVEDLRTIYRRRQLWGEAVQGSFVFLPLHYSIVNPNALKRMMEMISMEYYPNFTLFAYRQDPKLSLPDALALLIKEARQWLDFLAYREMDVVELASRMEFYLTSGKDFFTTVASVRALKILWQELLAEKEIPFIDCKVELRFEQSGWSDDLNLNRIIATTQAMASVISGCNRIIFPSELDDYDPMHARMLTNIQHIMKNEAYMDRVIDPGSGSYFIEELTNTLAQAARQSTVKLKVKQKNRWVR